MKRKIYDTLLDWKRQEKGKVALLIEGARNRLLDREANHHECSQHLPD